MKKHSEKDMYLPAWLLGLAVVFFAAAVLCVIFIHDRLLMIPCAVICALVGIAAALCWNNQWIKVINEEEFVYSSMFGRKKTYRFADIVEVKKNADSQDLIFSDGKVHIESCAVVSANLINSARKYAKYL